MAFDGTYEPFDGGYDDEPEWHCKACRLPIVDLEQAVRIEFQDHSAETRGMSGLYHPRCSKPFRSLAAIVNMNPWGGA